MAFFGKTMLSAANDTAFWASAGPDFANMSVWEIVNIAVTAALAIAFLVLGFVFLKKKGVRIFLTSGIGVFVASAVLNLYSVQLIALGFLVVLSSICIFFNMGSIREQLQNPTVSKNAKANEKAAGSLTIAYDEKKFYEDVNTTVLKLASTKTGAIMTFERKMNLDSYMKNGTIIDAPFTPELVETIFYVGTRLHDGAIVVRKNIIVAASVYYTPSTKALTGKFGSRHRAALGISEATDSVTVVCSEETGRISIAYDGKLDPVRKDEFLAVFKEYMNRA